MNVNKSAIATAIALSMGVGVSHAANMSSATFIMYGPDGSLTSNTCGVSGNCPNGVDPTLTGTIGNGVWGVASSETFFGSNWVAKSGTTFGPGTYSWDTLKNGTSNPKYTNIVVGPNQIGGHILFDWGNPDTLPSSPCGVAECSIDVVNIWNLSVTGSVTTYTSVDFGGNKANNAGSTIIGNDGTPGIQILDSASFENFSPNFDFAVTAAAVPVPAAVWLFGSGLLGLVGVARRKKSA